jgi:predicted nucleic acid-binding protein
VATLVDTSALYALVSRRDRHHEAALEAIQMLRRSELLTHNYIVVETTALVGRRLGADAVRDLHERILAAMPVRWVDESAHSSAVSALLVSGAASFVDVVSFEVMRRLRIERAFAFDRDFAEQGFELVP